MYTDSIEYKMDRLRQNDAKNNVVENLMVGLDKVAIDQPYVFRPSQHENISWPQNKIIYCSGDVYACSY